MPVSVRFNKTKEIKTFKEDISVSGLKLDISQKKVWHLNPEKEILKEMELEKTAKGNIINKIASSRYYVEMDTDVKDLVAALIADSSIRELGVVDEKFMAVGVIVRMELLNFLNMRYGKQLLINKSIKDVYEDEDLSFLISKVQDFFFARDIFSVIGEIKNQLEITEKVRFLLTKRDGEYAGVFTNIDLLIYLSAITRMDMEQAADLQSRIVKDKTLINNGAFDYISASRMAKGVGGDFYIIDELTEDQFVVSLCDVSGKGVSAGLLTTLLGALFRMYDFRKGLYGFVTKLNQYVYNSFNMEKYLTGFFSILNRKTGKLTYYDMGHAYVYIYRNNKMYHVKSSDKNFPIGFVPEIEPVANQLTLQKGDLLIVFTDGFCEQTDGESNEYNIVGLLPDIIEKTPFDELTDKILKDIDDFRGLQPQGDDMTITVLKYNGIG